MKVSITNHTNFVYTTRHTNPPPLIKGRSWKLTSAFRQVAKSRDFFSSFAGGTNGHGLWTKVQDSPKGQLLFSPKRSSSLRKPLVHGINCAKACHTAKQTAPRQQQACCWMKVKRCTELRKECCPYIYPHTHRRTRDHVGKQPMENTTATN